MRISSIQRTIYTSKLALIAAVLLCALAGSMIIMLIALISNRHDPNSTTSKPVLHVIRHVAARMQDLRRNTQSAENMHRFNELYNLAINCLGGQQLTNITGIDFQKLS
mgnify:CR=1 FL=1